MAISSVGYSSVVYSSLVVSVSVSSVSSVSSDSSDSKYVSSVSSASDSPSTDATSSGFDYESTLIGSTSPLTTASAYSDNFSFLSPKYSDNYLNKLLEYIYYLLSNSTVLSNTPSSW